MLFINFEGNEDKGLPNGNASPNDRSGTTHEKETYATTVNPNIEKKVTGSYPHNYQIFKVL